MTKNKVSDEELELLEVKRMITAHLKTLTPGSDEFQKALDQCSDVNSMLVELRAKKSSIEPWIPLFGHLGGISMMSVVEVFGHSFTSKAMSLVRPMNK